MAVYHFSARTVSRSAGRSSTAAAAYRAAERIVDGRTGEIHDYTRKGGVVASEVILPGGGTMERAALWNKVEAHHKRGDATVAREFVVALPAELDPTQRQDLARSYARELADRYRVAVDVNVHAPGKEGDQRNHHAHILLSACYASTAGALGKKAVELDPIHCQRHGLANVVEVERERWERLANQALEKAGQEARIDHRSLEAQGITDRLPGVHLGPTATAIERSGRESDIARRAREQADEFMAEMQAHVALQRAAERDLAELETQLAAAKWEARPVSERLAEVRQIQERLLQERRDLWDRKRFADTAAKTARPQAEVQKGIDALPAVRKAAGQAKARLEQLEAREAGLGWWQWIERRRVKSEKAKALADATVKAERLVEVRQLAQRPVREKVEAQQKALQAQQAAIEAQRQAKALAEANKATSERIKAQVAQRQAERAAPKVKERDHGLGM